MGHGVWLLLFLVGVEAGLCGYGPQVAGELDVAATTVPAPHARLGTRRTGPCSSRPRGHFLSVVRLYETNGNNNYSHHAGVVAFSRDVSLIARQLDNFHCHLCSRGLAINSETSALYNIVYRYNYSGCIISITVIVICSIRVS